MSRREGKRCRLNQPARVAGFNWNRWRVWIGMSGRFHCNSHTRAEVLVRIRELRNLIAHEYAADKMAEVYEAVFILSPELGKIAEQAADYSQSLIKRVQVS